MQRIKCLFMSTALLVLMSGSVSVVPAQGRIAVEKRISLSRGRSKTVRGKTDSATSYVYKIRGRKDQKLDARLTSEGGAATFSIVPPAGSLVNAAGVSQWAGALPETGEYSIVVVMNTTGDAVTPYALELKID